jgi:hypothetical protein
MTYEKYRSDLIKLGATEIMSEQEFNMKYLKETFEFEPLVVLPKKSKRPIKPTLENHVQVKIKKPKVVKPPKEPKPRYKPPKLYTDEEIKQRRAEARKKKRAENVAKGLTVDGKVRAEPKPQKSEEEIRADRLRWAKNYREKNKEKHLAYRREYRKKQKETQCHCQQ